MNLFQTDNLRPALLGSIHMPPFLYGNRQDIRQIETWLLRNIEHFAEGGFDSVMIQDNTPCMPGMDTKALVYISALCYSAVAHFPEFPMGVIIESNDAKNAITIAASTGLKYVRCKVFVGAMQKPGGLVEGNAREAFHARQWVDREVAICADIYDRMGVPLFEPNYKLAISQARKYGADAVILTGDSFAETCALIDLARSNFPSMPIWAGGGITKENVRRLTTNCNAMVVSSCLTQDGCKDEWDRKKIMEFVRTARE